MKPKKLEWTDYSGDKKVYSAMTPFFKQYIVEQNPFTNKFEIFGEPYDSLEEAKEVAQSNFEDILMSCYE